MSKTTRIISIALMVLPSLMLIMSSVMKLSHSQQMVEGFSKSALIHYLDLIGIIELVSVVLFLVPKTTKIGFLLLCSYLGGALSIELAGGQPPMAALFLAILWISVFLRNKLMFLPQAKTEKHVS